MGVDHLVSLQLDSLDRLSVRRRSIEESLYVSHLVLVGEKLIDVFPFGSSYYSDSCPSVWCLVP